MSIYEKLLKIQQEVRAPKEMRNDFGKFNYRSAEAIYEVAKPICLKHGALLHITDEIEVKADKPYIKATAELINAETNAEDKGAESIKSVGWARIPESLKGMNDCQVSGSASSYARKYAVSALFLLDDNKDPDTDEWQCQQQNTQKQPKPKAAEQPNPAPIQNKSYKDMTAEDAFEVIDAAAKSKEITDIMNAIDIR